MTPIHLIVIGMVLAFLGLLALFIAAIVAWQRLTELARLDSGDQSLSWRIMARGIVGADASVARAVMRFRILCALQAGVFTLILGATFGWTIGALVALILLSAVAMTKPAEGAA